MWRQYLKDDYEKLKEDHQGYYRYNPGWLVYWNWNKRFVKELIKFNERRFR